MPAARSRSSPTAAWALANALSTSSRAPRRVALEALARELQLDHQRHQPLLRAVVQVAPEPPALGVAGLDEPRARRAQRLQPRPQLDLQPRVLDRQRRRGRRLEAAARASRTAPASCSERADAPALVVDLRVTRPAPARRAAWPVAVDVAALGQPVGDVERRVAERVGERVAHAARVRGELLDQPRRRVAVRKKRVRTSPSRNAAGNSANAPKNDDLARPSRPSPTILRDHRARGRASRITAPSSSTGSRPRRWVGDRASASAGSAATRVSDRRRARPQAPGSAPKTPTTVGASAISNGFSLGQASRRTCEKSIRSGCSDGRRRSRARRRARSARPSSRPDGNASSRWSSSETATASDIAAERPQHGRVEELQAGQRDEDADEHHQHAGAVVRPPQPGVRADPDEAPGQDDADVGDRADRPAAGARTRATRSAARCRSQARTGRMPRWPHA